MNGHIGIDSDAAIFARTGGYRSASGFTIATSSARACAAVTPGFSRATTLLLYLAAEPLPLERRKRDRDVERPRLVVDLAAARRELEGVAHDPDNGERFAVERERAPDGRGVAPEGASPQTVANHDHFRVRPVVIGRQRAAHDRCNAEHAEHLGRDPRRDDALGFPNA